MTPRTPPPLDPAMHTYIHCMYICVCACNSIMYNIQIYIIMSLHTLSVIKARVYMYFG